MISDAPQLNFERVVFGLVDDLDDAPRGDSAHILRRYVERGQLRLHVGAAHVVVETDDAHIIGHAITALYKRLHGTYGNIVKNGDVALGKGLARIDDVEHACVCVVWSGGEFVDDTALFRSG